MPRHRRSSYRVPTGLATLLIVVSFLCESTSAAQSLSPGAQAALDAGAAAYAEGRYQTALDHFQHADALQHTPRITYNLAVVHEGLGRVHEADRLFRRYLQEAGEDAEWSHQANQALDRIRESSARIAVVGAQGFERITIDEVRHALAAPASYLVRPGNHTLVAEGAGGRVTVELSLAAGEMRRVDLRERVPLGGAPRGGCASCRATGSAGRGTGEYFALAVLAVLLGFLVRARE
ncbi:MAG: tetratricopeptide repeat protein [Sandaracinaceae bacterium]|nr:tetratricopeptide repeat protein [Sandaracinaceae bacterium]